MSLSSAAADRQDVSPPPPGPEDAFCKVVRFEIGTSQLRPFTGADLASGGREWRSAMERAVLANAWTRAMPGEPPGDWVRVVQPIEPPIEDIEPGRPLVVLVAGLRQPLARAARAGDEKALDRIERARASFGEPAREEIASALAEAAATATR